MPEVSVLVSTFRPGGLDITLAGFRDQTYEDVEYILVDRRYELRHDRVMALAKDYGVPLLHVPEHRRNGKWAGIGAAWNTAMALARGEHIIFLLDWTYAPPGWIEAHLSMRGERRYLLCPYRYLPSPPLRLLKPCDFTGARDLGGSCTEPVPGLDGVFDEISAFPEPFDPKLLDGLKPFDPPHQDPRVAPPGTMVPYTWTHVKNESMPRSVAWALDGLDERLDRGKGPLDLDWALRLRAVGMALVWGPLEAMAWCIDPRWYIATMPWGDRDKRLEGRWSMYDGLTYNSLREQEMGRGGPTTAKNPWHMESLAAQLAPWRTADRIDANDLDRPDQVYWGGREIWPETP